MCLQWYSIIKTKFSEKMVKNSTQIKILFPFCLTLYNLAVITLIPSQSLSKYYSPICFYLHLLKFKNQLAKGQN